ncbi:MAG: hypothetical protein WCA08_22300 [Desulfoferrobacter sp.]
MVSVMRGLPPMVRTAETNMDFVRVDLQYGFVLGIRYAELPIPRLRYWEDSTIRYLLNATFSICQVLL